MDYGRILKRSVELTWRNKLLWVLGILAALFSGGNAGQGMRYSFNPQDMENLRDALPYGMRGLPLHSWGWSQFAVLGLGLIALLVLLALVLAVVSIIVGYTCQGALIAAADELNGGQKPTFRVVIGRGWKRLLRLFAQDLLIGLATMIVALLVLIVYAIAAGLLLAPGIVMIVNESDAYVVGIVWVVLLGLAVVVGLIAIVAAIAAVQSIVQAYAQRASILELDGVFEAISNGWKLMRANLRQSLLMWLWLVLISLGIALVLIPVLILLAMLVIAPSAGVYALSESGLLTGLVAVPLLAVFVLALIWFGGLLTAFESTVWTLTYNELRAQDPVIVPSALPAEG